MSINTHVNNHFFTTTKKFINPILLCSLFIGLVLSCFSLSSCRSDSDEPIDTSLLVGVWKASSNDGDYILNLRSNLTYILKYDDDYGIGTDSGTYSMSGKTLTSMYDSDDPMIFTVLELSDTKMVLRNDEDVVILFVRTK